MPKRPHRKLTPEVIAASAARYKTRTYWRKADESAYEAARRRGLLDEVCAHMPKPTRLSHPLEDIKASAARFATRGAWRKADLGAYQAAVRRGILDQVCAHMPKPHRKLSLEVLRALAAQYTSRIDWFKADQSAYVSARNRGLLDVVCVHMKSVRRANGYWTLERCKASAATFRFRQDWEHGEGAAYAAAQRNGWIAKCCSHMPSRREPVRKWTCEALAASARPYSKRIEWLRANAAAYKAAKRLGVFDEVTAHMKPTPRKTRS